MCRLRTSKRASDRSISECEEVNRIVTDQVSTLLLNPTATAIRNLKSEGRTDGVHLVGDVMYDVALAFADVAERQSRA